MKFPFFNFEKKANPAGGALMVSYALGHNPKSDARVQIAEGFQMNAIVYRAIKELTTAISSIELELYDTRGNEIENHPILDLLRRPNPSEAYDAFITGCFTDFLITGEMSFSGVKAGAKLRELWRHSPSSLTVMPGSTGLPAKYVFKMNGKEIAFPVDQVTGACELFFFKTYNPSDYWRGQSPLMAAGLSCDIHNAGMKWNYSLLRNGARPSGIVKFLGNPAKETIGRIRELFKRTIQGANNAGEIPMLVDGADWQATDQTARDMDFISTMKETAKYIASAYGVPLPLIDNDASTFNNVEQAKERLYTDTVIPLLQGFLEQLNEWLSPYLGGNRLSLDLDSIPALEKLRQVKFDRMIAAVGAGVLTIDEAREAIGYEPVGGVAEQLMIPSGRIPIEMAGMDTLTPDEQATATSLRRANFTDREIREMIEAERHASCSHS